jgi:hypothetical protein
MLAAAALLCGPAALEGQWIDAEMPRRGELQIALSGQNLSVDQWFTSDGTLQPLSSLYSAVLDSRLVAPLDSLDGVLADFYPALGLTAPDPSSLGLVEYDVLLERTHAPISLRFSPLDWLAAFTVVPLVRGQSFVGLQLDSATAAAGRVELAFGGDLLPGLGTGIAELEAIIAADTLPPDRQAQATSLLSNARTMEGGLLELQQQQYVPTDSSAAGRDLAGFYDQMQSDFQSFDVTVPGLELSQPITSQEAAALTSGQEFGIDPIEERDTGIKFGDIELGLSLQPLNTFRPPADRPRPTFPVRARFDALYRFPTGTPPTPERITDVGTGDGQPDIELRGTLDVGLGSRFWLTAYAGYNMQLAADVRRLITSPLAPIQPGAYIATVNWDPGDVLTLIAAPRFNFTQVITFSGLFVLTRRGRDQVEPVDPIDPGAPFVPSDLEVGTEYDAFSVGFSARYATTNWTGARRSSFPVDVELTHLKTKSASGGIAPQRNIWQVSVRFYVFGGQ